MTELAPWILFYHEKNVMKSNQIIIFLKFVFHLSPHTQGPECAYNI